MKNTICVWRSKSILEREIKSVTCPYCLTMLIKSETVNDSEVDGMKRWTWVSCPLCGWKTSFMRNSPPNDSFNLRHWIEDPPWYNQSILKTFELNSNELSLDELGTHLKRNYSDVYSLHPRRFEKIVSDVLSNEERESILTQESRDGGVDIFLRNIRTNEIDAVVECKRYAKDRRVGIGIVQRIAGVAIQWEAKKAYVVTCSGFTRDAVKSANRFNQIGKIGIDLVAATELLKLFGSYNINMPPLNRLTARVRNDIIRANSKVAPSKANSADTRTGVAD